MGRSPILLKGERGILNGKAGSVSLAIGATSQWIGILSSSIKMKKSVLSRLQRSGRGSQVFKFNHFEDSAKVFGPRSELIDQLIHEDFLAIRAKQK